VTPAITPTERNENVTISQTEAATRKVRRAQAELDKLLEAGEDASTARADLLTAQTELDLAEQAARERAQADEARIEAEAAELIAEVGAKVSAGVAEILQRIGPLPGARVEKAWALGVARARRELAALRTEAEAVRERLTGQQTRLSSLKADRQAVIARRLAGDLRDADGATLALLDADIEGLSGLATRTAAELNRLEADLAATIERHAQAEKRWAAAIQDAWTDALSELALIAEGVIVEVSGAMRVHGGDRKRWSPSLEVSNLLHGRTF
jgi:chromosome segregation ATPase